MYKNIERLHGLIESNLFTINGNLGIDRLTDAFIALADEILKADTDEFIWSIGEMGHETLDEMIIGAYWFFADYHRGQASKEYLALCRLGEIFQPNMATNEENDTYQMLEQSI